MKVVNTSDQNRTLLTATNEYGKVSLSVMANRVPTNGEAVEIMKLAGYWIEGDKVTINPCHKEVLAFLE